MDLFVLSKSNVGINGNLWTEVANKLFFPSCESESYFLCLPQHKEACLHWLNGGDVLVKSKFVPSWEVVAHGQLWGDFIGWMREDAQYRIKPSKEKRWIAVNSFGDVMPVHCKDLESAKQLVQYKDVGINGEIQYIEIEIEV